jgi:hypothetical protein
MAKQDCMLYAVAAAVVLYLCQAHINSLLYEVLLFDCPPSVVLDVSLSVLGYTICMLPVTFNHLPAVPALRRLNTMFLALSVVFLFIFSQDLTSGNIWDLTRLQTAANSPSSSASLGVFSSSSQLSSWLLAASAVLAAVGVTTAVALPQVSALVCVCACVCEYVMPYI